jgi:hypothetical protein
MQDLGGAVAHQVSAGFVALLAVKPGRRAFGGTCLQRSRECRPQAGEPALASITLI